MDSVNERLQTAVDKHGIGVAIALIDALARSHAAHLESTPQGMYAKLHYDKAPSAQPRAFGSRVRPQASKAGTRNGSKLHSVGSNKSSTYHGADVFSNGTDSSDVTENRHYRDKLLEHKVHVGPPPLGLDGLRVITRNTFVNVVEIDSGTETHVSAPAAMETPPAPAPSASTPCPAYNNTAVSLEDSLRHELRGSAFAFRWRQLTRQAWENQRCMNYLHARMLTIGPRARVASELEDLSHTKLWGLHSRPYERCQ